MRLTGSAFIPTLSLILIFSLVAACSGKEDRKLQHLERGLQYLAQDNYDKARVEFKNLGQIDPKEALAYWHLGEVEEHERAFEKAFSYYTTAIKLDPELILPRQKIVQIYIAQAAAARSYSDTIAEANALALAQEQITEILTRKPDQAEGLMLQASFWLQEGKIDQALHQLESLVEKDAEHQSAVVLLARLYTQEKRTADAEAVLINAVEQIENNVELREVLARFYENLGKRDKAEQVLQALVDDFQEQSAYRITLSAFLVRSERPSEAENILREAITIDPDNIYLYSHFMDLVLGYRGLDAAIEELKLAVSHNPDLDKLQLKLASFYRSNDQNEQAQQLLEKLIDIHGMKPTGLQARVILADWLTTDNIKTDRASVLIEEVLRKNPQDYNALLLRGKIAANKHDWLAAINDYRFIMADQPDSVEILQLLAEAYAGNKDLELATETLTKLIKLTPKGNKLRLQLAELLAENGKVSESLQQLERVLKLLPGNLAALGLKYELLTIKGDVPGMLDVARALQKYAPDLDGGFIREARLLVAQKKYVDAAKITNQVLTKNPDSIDGLLTKTDILTAQQEYDEALKVNRRIQQLRPDSAIGYLREARLLRGSQDSQGAIQTYKTALEKAPDLLDALTELIGLELISGNKSDAKTRLVALLKENSDHPIANYLLGTVLYSMEEYEGAEQVLKKQLVLDEMSEASYSRLAGVRVARNDLQGAVAAYEAGIKVLPVSNRLTIELAGIRELEGDYIAARALYEKVLDREPHNTLSMNNLAALLLDHWPNDHKILERVAGYAVPLSEIEHPAYRDTAGWIYYHLGDYDRALKLLSKTVETNPTTAVFQYHLGMLHDSMGNSIVAKNHLEKALLEESEFAGFEVAREVLGKN